MYRMMSLSAVAVASVVSTSTLTAEVIVGYTSVNGTTAPATTTASGVTSAPLSRGIGLAQASGSTFNSNGYDTDNTSFTDAIADGDFLTFGFTSTTAYNLDTLDIRYDRSSTGPSNLAIQIDTGSGFGTFFTDSAVDASGETVPDIDLSSFDNVVSATFRIVGFGSTSTGGTFDPENVVAFNNGESIVVNGTVVPEPASLALVGLGSLLIAGRRRRQA